jgi:Cys-rich repeat protein
VSDYDYAVGWNDPNNISSPVTGSGFRERPACVDDGQCASGFVCTPRASYLEVAQVDLGCERNKGALTGGASCAADSDCGTGLCLPTAAAGALQCYSACATNGDCLGGQSCSATTC